LNLIYIGISVLGLILQHRKYFKPIFITTKHSLV
jgi:hypothetical protein